MKFFSKASKSEPKFDTLLLLVHPLYHYLEEYHRKQRLTNLRGAPESELKEINASLKKRILKPSLGEYGKLLNNFTTKQNVCVCIVKYNLADPKLQEIYDIELSRFIKRAKTIFGNRLVVTNFYNNKHDKFNVLFPENYYANFNSKIKIIGFGEYLEVCVNDWSKDYVPNELNKHDIIVKETKIIKDKSVSSHYPDVGVTKKFIPAHERRTEQQRMKSIKARNKHLSTFLEKRLHLK